MRDGRGAAAGIEQTCTGAADMTERRLRGECTIEGSGGHEFVVVDDTIYITYPGEKVWAKEQIDDPEQLDLIAPENLLRVVRAASRSTERVGEEDVRGVPTVRYALAVDCSQADLILDCGRETVSVDVWIAEDGLVRRMRWDDHGAVTFEFYDFGKLVEIEPPPTEKVVEGGLYWGEEDSTIETGEIVTEPDHP